MSTQTVSYLTFPASSPWFLEPGDFSRDSSQLAISYYDQMGSTGGLAVLEVQTGQVVAQISMDTIIPQTAEEDFHASRAIMGEWRTEGVRFVPNCNNCSPDIFDNRYYVWRPGEDTVKPVVDAYYSIFGSPPLATGEYLYTVVNPNNTVGVSGFLLAANGVEYYSDGAPTQGYAERNQIFNKESNGPLYTPVVYQNDEAMNLQTAQWVLDGQAFFVVNEPPTVEGSSVNFNAVPTEGTLVYRDGTQRQVAFDSGNRFLAGTTDGWLMRNKTGKITHFRFDDLTLTSSYTAAVIAQIDPNARLLFAPLIGRNRGAKPFEYFQLELDVGPLISENFREQWHITYPSHWQVYPFPGEGYMQLDGEYEGHEYRVVFGYPIFEDGQPETLDAWTATYTVGIDTPVIKLTVMDIPARLILDTPIESLVGHRVLISWTGHHNAREISIVQIDDLPYDSAKMKAVFQALLDNLDEVADQF